MAASLKNEGISNLRKAVLLRDAAALTDAQLLERYLSHREDAAMAALVQRHAAMVWGVCCRVLHNHHDAEDAFQATFLVLVRKASSIASRELLPNWLYGVAHQTALKARATAAKRKQRERQVNEMPEPEVLDNAHWPELQQLLDQELSQLPEKYRVVIVLCDLEGKTRKEAAKQLSCPEGTVAGRLARARVMLAKRLARHDLAVSGGALAAALSQAMVSASVPTSVVSLTIEATSLFSAGHGANDVVSTKVAILTEGVLKAMLMSKLKFTTVVLLFVTAGALACGVLAGQQQGLPDDVKEKPQNKPADPPKEDKLQTTHADSNLLKVEQIDPETIAAYERRGAHYGRFTSVGFVVFPLEADAASKSVPGFSFVGGLREGTLKNLPPVKIPFGLGLRTTISDAELKELKNLENLTLLDLGGTKVTDAGLKELKVFKNLTQLNLEHTSVTDAGLKELKDLKNLADLHLGSTQLTGSGLKELKDLKNLTHLNLMLTKITDAGLNDLKDLKNLTDLVLDYTKVTDSGLKELKGLQYLAILDLTSTEVTDAGLRELKELQSLVSLNLAYTKVGDEGMKELRDLKNLSSLGLYSTKIGDAGLKELSNLKNLKNLTLANTKVTDAGLKELSNLKNLNSLRLENTKVTDAGLKELKDLKNLNELSLVDTAVTDLGMKELKNLKNLAILCIQKTQVTDAGLRELKDLKRLIHIDLSNTRVTGQGVKELQAALPNCIIVK